MKKNIAGFILFILIFSLLLIFPIAAQFLGKNGKSVTVTPSDITLPFLAHEKAKAVFVYFGYVGCTSICIPALNEFTPMYQRIHQLFPKSAFYFVNLNPTQPKEWIEPFAKSFNTSYHGVYASKCEIEQYERDFNLAITSNAEEMGHSSNLYLLIREHDHYRLKRIYITHPYSEEQILNDLKELYR